MKVRLVFACALVGAALVGSAGIASADDRSEPQINFSFYTVRPGDTITIYGVCDVPEFPPTPVRSDILDSGDLIAHDQIESGWLSSAEGTVRPDVSQGRYPVSFDCDGTTVTRYLEVRTGPEPPPYAAIGIQDEIIEPGKKVLVGAGCHHPDFIESPVESPVLTAAGNLVRKRAEPVETRMTVSGRIDEDAKPGTYPISFQCVDRKVTGEFTVTAPDGPGGAEPQVPVKPRGPADTGSLELGDSGDGASVVAIGVAALLAAAGAGSTAIVRRRRRT